MQDYNVRPSEEGRFALAQQALSRIVEVVGFDYLDGHQLPPDNDEFWDPRIVAVNTYNPNDDSSMANGEHMLSLSNRFVREVNILAIASGGEPVFIKWEDVDLERSRQSKLPSIDPLGAKTVSRDIDAEIAEAEIEDLTRAKESGIYSGRSRFRRFTGTET